MIGLSYPPFGRIIQLDIFLFHITNYVPKCIDLYILREFVQPPPSTCCARLGLVDAAPSVILFCHFE